MLPVREVEAGETPGEAGAPGPEAPGAWIVEFLVQELAAMKRRPPEGVPLPEVRFREELGFDSLDRMEFIARVEQRFRLPLADDEVEGLVTLGQVARLVAERGGRVEAPAAGRPEPPGQPQSLVHPPPSGHPPPPGPPHSPGPAHPPEAT